MLWIARALTSCIECTNMELVGNRPTCPVFNWTEETILSVPDAVLGVDLLGHTQYPRHGCQRFTRRKRCCQHQG